MLLSDRVAGGVGARDVDAVAPFDEITLPSLDAPPPIWLSGASSIHTPSAWLPGRRCRRHSRRRGRCRCSWPRPGSASPRRLRCATPSLALAEMTLPAPPTAPPMVLLDE